MMRDECRVSFGIRGSGSRFSAVGSPVGGRWSVVVGRWSVVARRLAGQSSHSLQRIDLRDRLIVADAHDAREAQRIATLVARARLHDVERHLQDDLWLD